MSTTYHPQTDDQSEALNCCIEMYLHCFVFERPRNWLQFIPWAKYWYNTSYQTVSGFSPFQVVYGWLPPVLFRDPIATVPADVEQLLQQRMKQIIDRKRANVEFQLGDMVYVKLQPYRQVTLREHHH